MWDGDLEPKLATGPAVDLAQLGYQADPGRGR
jgi:hypothetical protein